MRVLVGNSVEAQIDKTDFPLFEKYKWFFNRPKGYIYTRINGQTVYLHRLLMSATQDVEVDHINGNPLDNRKSNMRLCTHKQNLHNRKGISSCGYKGVSMLKSRYKSAVYCYWRARIKVNGREVALGLFATPEEAARAYNKAAVLHFGAFAYLNNV